MSTATAPEATEVYALGSNPAESARLQTAPACPCRVLKGCPAPASQSRTVPSSPPLATTFPSAESATLQTPPV